MCDPFGVPKKADYPISRHCKRDTPIREALTSKAVPNSSGGPGTRRTLVSSTNKPKKGPRMV